MRHVVLLSILVIMSGCRGGPTVTENQCYAGDWETLGYRDGAQGLRSSQLLQHQDACVPYGVVPDREAYMAGWNAGALEYCQPNSAFEVGELGYGHANICPAHLQSAFTAAYRQGRQLYLARRDVANLEQLIVARESRLDYVRAQIVTTSTDQLDPTLTVAERVDLIAYTQRLVEEKARIEQELPRLQADLIRQHAQLNEMRQSLVSVVY